MPRTRFEVNPRYTAGSPAMVDETTADKVLMEEQRGYSHALTGIFGSEEQERAQRCGMEGVVWSWTEHYRSVNVHDRGAVQQRTFRSFDEYRAWTAKQRRHGKEG